MAAVDLDRGDHPAATLPAAESGRAFQMLEGVRVADLSTSVAGPYAAMLLGDMGADVLKIERPAGDDSRGWGPPFLDEESLWFLSVNRNKRSLCLDYSVPRGLQLLHELMRSVDILIVNSPSRVASKLGIDHAALRACNQRLIYVSITGFGIDGERCDWPCYDLIAEGYSGVMDVTGESDGEPQKIGAPAADMLAGQDAAFAATSALVRRATTGKGALVDVALVDSMTRFLTCRIVPYLGSGQIPRRSAGKDSVIAVYQAFRTSDEPITIGLGNDAIWARFWRVLGRPDVALDERFATNRLRRERRAEIVADIQEILATAPRAHWLALFREARIPAGPINRIDELAADPELRRRGMFYSIRRDGHSVPQVGTAIRIDGETGFARLAPPRLGEHSAELLGEILGYDQSTIAALRTAKVIGAAEAIGAET